MEISLPIQQRTASILSIIGFKMDAFEALIQPPSAPSSGFYPVNPDILRLPKREFVAFAYLLKYRNRSTGTAFLHPNALGCTTRHYNRIMSHLEKQGFIAKVGERLYSVRIHDANGDLYPCFSRFFWERLTPTDYLEFRFATFLGLSNLIGGRNTARDIQAGLRCRMTLAGPLATAYGKDTSLFDFIQTKVRFRNKEWGRGTPYDPRSHRSNSSPINAEKAVSQASPAPRKTCPNPPETVSTASPLTREIPKEELTRDQPAFFEVRNFAEVGFPAHPFRIPVNVRSKLELLEYADILQPGEVAFLGSLSIYLLGQSYFKSISQSTLSRHLVNAYLLLKSRISKIKLSRTSMDYLCGTLRILVQEDRPNTEIERLRDLAKARMLKAANEAYEESRASQSSLATLEMANRLHERAKALIPDWESMDPVALNMMIAIESMEGGRFNHISRELRGESNAIH